MSNSGAILETSIWTVSSPTPGTIIWGLIDILSRLYVYPLIGINPKFVPNKDDIENITAENEKEEACETEVFFSVYRKN